MRKILSILLAVLLLTTLVACGGGDEPTSSTPVSSESSTPESSAPETSEPETSEPDVSEPETSDTSEGDQTTTTKKDDGKTTTAKKDDGKTTTTKKDDGKTTTTKKDDGKTTTTKKDDGKTTTTKKDDGKTTTTKKTTTTTKKTTTTTVKPQTPNTEKPVTVDTADYYNPKSSVSDAQAETMRQAVLNTKDSGLKPTGFGETYYISPNGNDNADGLTKATAWQTVKNLENGYAATNGSVILFERGGVYRSVALNLMIGVSVGAYGSGPKPQLLGGDKDYADEKLWKNAGNNIWYADVTEAVKDCPGDTIMPEDIGNIIFDYGKKVASEYKQRVMKNVDSDYDFFYEKSTKRVYLYLSKGNPGKVHNSIEMSPNTEVIRIRSHNHTIENLCIRYAASGIGTAGANNITVRGCEIGYIGGGMQGNTRAGNAITFFNTTDNCLVEDNWLYQCYDAGYSHQSQQGAQTNITVKNNLIEYCLYNIEIWTPGNKEDQPMKNCLVEGNIMCFAGFGFGTINRMGSSTIWASHISFNSNKSVCDNVVIKNNIFDTSYRYLVCITHPNDTATPKLGPTITGNTWIQQPFRVNASQNGDPRGTVASVAPLANGGVLYCGDQAAMETSVKKVDTNPVKILLNQ